MGKGRIRTFSRKLNKKVCREKKKVHNGTKIFTFLTLDVDIANDVYKGLINVRQIFF